MKSRAVKGDKYKKEECGSYGRCEVRRNLADIGEGEKLILKLVLKKQGERAWYGFI
jgi:hypothetical protein